MSCTDRKMDGLTHVLCIPPVCVSYPLLGVLQTVEVRGQDGAGPVLLSQMELLLPQAAAQPSLALLEVLDHPVTLLRLLGSHTHTHARTHRRTHTHTRTHRHTHTQALVIALEIPSYTQANMSTYLSTCG